LKCGEGEKPEQLNREYVVYSVYICALVAREKRRIVMTIMS
jgi:hypothetical protein